MSRLATLLLLLASLAPLGLGAQNPLVARADSLLRSGRVFAAESLYYRASRERPRDPSARLGLGRYLAARGAWRVGAVLMEEARFFGGDAKVIAAQLAPVYQWLGDYRSLASLPGSEMPYAERARAEYLRENAGALAGPDSTVVPYQAGAADALGSIPVVIGNDTIQATIDPSVSGLVLDTGWVRDDELRVFKSQFDSDHQLFTAVVEQLTVGEMLITRVPARFASTGGRGVARIGMDVLAPLQPTFDEAGGSVTLRRSPAPAGALLGDRVATVTFPQGIWLVTADGVRSLMSEEARALLAGAPWTLDAKRGEIVVAR